MSENVIMIIFVTYPSFFTYAKSVHRVVCTIWHTLNNFICISDIPMAQCCCWVCLIQVCHSGMEWNYDPNVSNYFKFTLCSSFLALFIC